MRFIIKKIKKASKKGMYFIEVSEFIMTSDIVSELKYLGFKVFQSEEYSTSDIFIISWIDIKSNRLNKSWHSN